MRRRPPDARARRGSAVARAPAEVPRVAMLRMKTPAAVTCCCILTGRRESHPRIVLVGSTATTPMVRRDRRSSRLAIPRVLFPAPGAPVMPINPRGRCGKMLLTSSSPGSLRLRLRLIARPRARIPREDRSDSDCAHCLPPSLGQQLRV